MCIFSAIRRALARILTGLVLAPADGRVILAGEAVLPDELELPAGRYQRVAIFMNVFDVHVNRSPLAAEVMARSHHAGKFVNASLDKASEDNERLALSLQAAIPAGGSWPVGVVQIAGLVARRILCSAEPGDQAECRPALWVDPLWQPGGCLVAGERPICRCWWAKKQWPERRCWLI